MRVVLVKLPFGRVIGLEMISLLEPLGLECVAGALEPAGHECRIVDFRLDGVERGTACCVQFEPAIVGIQCNFTTERFRTVRIAQALKRALPRALVVVGGHDASRDSDWFTDPAVDAVVIGDGEAVMPDLAAAVETGRKLASVPGLMLNTDCGPVLTPERESLIEADELPLPARHLIREYADHYYLSLNKPTALLETARGCPFKCNFCSVWKFHGGHVREKSPARVVQELAEITAPTVFITDDICWLNVKRGMEMARQIRAAGISKYFRVQARTDIICRHPELVEAWRQCGRLSVFLGFEALDDAGLQSVNKRNLAVNNQRALEILKDLDVGYTPNFIVDPAWQPNQFERLRRWVEENGAYNSGFSVLTPLPGTDLWDQVGTTVTTTDWELYDLVHAVLPTRLPLDQFYDEYARLWKTTLEVRYQQCGRLRMYGGFALALLAGRLSLAAMRRGMHMTRALSDPRRFLEAHTEDKPG